MTQCDFDWMVSNHAVRRWKAPIKASVSGVSLLQLSPFFTSIFLLFPKKRLTLRLPISMNFFGQFLKKFRFNHKPISQTVLNLHKNKQHFLKFALFFIKVAKNHRNRLIFIAFYHAAVEKTHLLKVFFWLVFSLYRMVMMQRKLPRTARREWRPSSSLRDNRKPQMIYTSVWKGISF